MCSYKIIDKMTRTQIPPQSQLYTVSFFVSVAKKSLKFILLSRSIVPAYGMKFISIFNLRAIPVLSSTKKARCKNISKPKLFNSRYNSVWLGL